MTDEKLSGSAFGAHNELIAAAWLMKQGYDVFRNMAPVGPVDIIGFRHGKTELFDVKTAYHNAEGQLVRQKFSKKQIELGVKCICVLPDGSCELDARDLYPGKPCTCVECNTEYVPKKWGSQTYCTTICQGINYRKRKREKKAAGTEPLF